MTTMLHIAAMALLLIAGSPDGEGKGDCALFSIGRSVDVNRIYYEVQLAPDGTLDSKEPIKVHWVKYTKGGAEEKLSFLQRKLAYGLVFDEISANRARFHFVSYAARELHLEKGLDGKFHVFMESNGKRVALNDIYINITGGTFMVPHIEAVTIKTTDIDNGLAFTETITP